MKYSGKDLRVSIKVAGNYVQLPGERSSAGALTNEQVDTTTKDDRPWRALTAVGTRFTEITASGVMRDNVDKAAWNALMAAIFDGTELEVRLDSAFGLVVKGLFMTPSLERAGEHNGAETYTISFSSTGVMSTSDIVGLPPVITSALTAMFTWGLPFSYQITADNSPTSFGAAGLPDGLSVNTSTGLISGTPGTVVALSQPGGGSGYAVQQEAFHYTNADHGISNWYRVTVTMPATALSGSSEPWNGFSVSVDAEAGSQIFDAPNVGGAGYKYILTLSPGYPLPTTAGPASLTFYVRGSDRWAITVANSAGVAWSCAFLWGEGAPSTTISATNAYGTDNETLSFVPAVDPALWVGAWDVEASGEPNLVAAGTGGPLDVIGFTGYTLAAIVAGGPLTQTKCVSLPSGGASSYQRGAVITPQQTLTEFTLAAFLKGDATGHAPALRIFQAVDVSAQTVQFALGISTLTIGGAFYTIPTTADANWHHYALTWRGSDGATEIFLDGVSVWTGTTLIGTVLAGWAGFDANTASLNGFGDLFALHKSVLSPAAIALLAAGHMPDPAGNLI